jgi:hypothetical protein
MAEMHELPPDSPSAARRRDRAAPAPEAPPARRDGGQPSFSNVVTEHGIFDAQGHFHGYTTTTAEQIERAEAEQTARVWAAIEGRQRREAEAAAERDRAEAARGKAELDRYYEEAKAAYLSSGGAVGDFTAAWTKLKAEYLAEQAKAKLTHHERDVEQRVQKARGSSHPSSGLGARAALRASWGPYGASSASIATNSGSPLQSA